MPSISTNPVVDFAKYALVGAASGLGPAALGYAFLRTMRESSRNITEKHFQSRHPVGNELNKKV